MDNKNQANVSNSISVTEAYKKNFGPSLNIPLIYNGFKQSSQSQYEGLDYNNNKIHILFAGRFVPQKGIESLIQIVEAVSEDTFDFTIAGTGPLSELLHTKLGNKSNVKIVPPFQIFLPTLVALIMSSSPPYMKGLILYL